MRRARDNTTARVADVDDGETPAECLAAGTWFLPRDSIGTIAGEIACCVPPGAADEDIGVDHRLPILQDEDNRKGVLLVSLQSDVKLPMCSLEGKISTAKVNFETKPQDETKSVAWFCCTQNQIYCLASCC